MAGALPRRLRRPASMCGSFCPNIRAVEEKGLPLDYHGYPRAAVPVSQTVVDAEIVESRLDGVTVYLVEKDEYFYRDNLYSTQDGTSIPQCGALRLLLAGNHRDGPPDGLRARRHPLQRLADSPRTRLPEHHFQA